MKHTVGIIQATVVCSLLLLAGGCSRETAVAPPVSNPEFRRYQWVVVTDEYVPVYAEPVRTARPVAVLREGEVLPVGNLQVRQDTVHGQQGRWYYLEIADAENGWVFESSFRGFYLLEQAQHYTRVPR
ncbi:hypothetical protein [Spirochaeta africana]|uniref:SH3 domain-containing protein n=1 Tax=Spirochaeta africana (strain ATCC 700263 / DSM 8902 / Z-7692) TaxID=889378 RepID=H9UGP3_SPIAZ|nr:hypothetical protein [Spirochaeta africana]AFG36686.1 hypothetical protein Spiaf_0585 [Spirochaeta africana DSM 8902]